MVSCILRHRGVQLILAYSWARPAILVAGKGREGMFLFLLFLHFHSCSSFFPVLLISTLSFLPFSRRRHKMIHKGWLAVKPQHNQKTYNTMQYHTILLCRPRWLSWMRRPTGDQEVAGSTPAEVGNILSWRLIMKYFLRSFSPFRWFKKGSCQFLAKECAQYWLTA